MFLLFAFQRERRERWRGATPGGGKRVNGKRERERRNVMKKRERETEASTHFPFASELEVEKIKKRRKQRKPFVPSPLLCPFPFLFSAMASKRISKVRWTLRKKRAAAPAAARRGENDGGRENVEERARCFSSAPSLSSLSGRASHRALPVRGASFDRRGALEATRRRVSYPWATSPVPGREGLRFQRGTKWKKTEGEERKKRPSRERERERIAV